LGATRRQQDRLAQRELVFGQGSGLVGTQDIDTRHFLDGGQLGDDGLLFGQRQRAQGHGDGENGGHRHRNGGDEQNEHKLQNPERVSKIPVVADDDVMKHSRGDHDHGQDDGDDDQEVADLKHRFLGMAHGTGAGDELCGSAEEGVGAGRNHDAQHLALFDDASRIGLVSDLLGNGQGLARQGGLIDRCVVSADEPQIGGNDCTEPDLHNIARH
jgi:hypothetical protein